MKSKGDKEGSSEKKRGGGRQINRGGGKRKLVAARHAMPAAKQMERSRRGWK